MQSVIKQIYSGDLCPAERSKVCIAEFYTAKNAAVQAHDAFEEKLCQSMKEELDEYLSKESDVTAYHMEQVFSDGFRLGAQLMLEVLEVGKDD